MGYKQAVQALMYTLYRQDSPNKSLLYNVKRTEPNSKKLIGNFIFSEGLKAPRVLRPKGETKNKAKNGGGGRDRTDDLKLAKLPLSQLSYAPGIFRKPLLVLCCR